MYAYVEEMQVLVKRMSFMVHVSLQRGCMLCKSLASHALVIHAWPGVLGHCLTLPLSRKSTSIATAP